MGLASILKAAINPFEGVKQIKNLFSVDEPDPLPPLPKRTDPEIEAARKKQRLLAKRRKGRGASILTSGQGVEGGLGSVSRPEARSSNLLGN